ncbi:response regulator transcription factor, partial [Bacillus pseudomycoides]
NKEVASELEITEKTGKAKVRSILGKLKKAERNEEVLYAVKEGLV